MSAYVNVSADAYFYYIKIYIVINYLWNELTSSLQVGKQFYKKNWQKTSEPKSELI